MAVIRASLEDIIPFVIAAVWLVVQIAGAAAKKKAAPQRRPAPARTGDEDAGEDPFAELMRKLGGVNEFKMPAPVEPAEMKPERPRKPDDVEALPDITPILPKAATPKPEPVQVPAPDVYPKMSSFKQAMPSMKLPTMNLSFQTSEKSGSGFPRVGKIINPEDRQTLRRALLGQIILGKPRALEGWSTGRVE